MSHHSDIFFASPEICQISRNSLKKLIIKAMNYLYFKVMMIGLETLSVYM